MDVLFWTFSLVAGGIVGVIITRLWDRWFTPFSERELWVDFSAKPLFLDTPAVAASGLKYTLDATEIARPYRVTLWAWRVGAKDLRADDFAGDLVAKIGVPVIASSLKRQEQTGRAIVDFQTDDGDALLVLKPSLVRPDFVVTYDFICDGIPTLQVTNPVADLRVGSFYLERGENNKIAPALATVGGLALVIGIGGMFVAGIASRFMELGALEAAVPIGGALGIVGIGLLAGSSAVTPRRAKLARKLLQSRTKGYVLDRNQIRSPADDLVFQPRSTKP